MQAFRDAGYRIPEDVSIIGFDDMPNCEYITPPLTTIQVPIQFMGEIATVRIIQLIEGQCAKPLKIEISTTLIQRKSVSKK